nr:hypothetical protein [Actinomycetales bacterium]
MNPHPTQALRTALLYCAVPALVLAVLQAAVAAMSGASSERVWPGIVTMMVAQGVLLVATAACVVGLVRVASGTDPQEAARSSAGALTPFPLILLGLLAATVVAWLVMEPASAIGALAFALVGAQAWFALRAARRVLERSAA